MKKIKIILSVIVLVFASIMGLTSCGNDEEIIAVVKYGTHTSLDEIEETIVDTLKESTLEDGTKVTDKYDIMTYNCQFSADTTAQIMTSLKRKNVKCIIPIATPTAMAALNSFKDIPLIFSAVSDCSGFIDNQEAPEGNITGTSDAIQIDTILDMATSIKTYSTLGYIYNPAEANSVSNLEKIRAYVASASNLSLEVSTINNASELNEVASNLVKKVDAMLVTDDNTVASTMSRLAQICKSEKIPLYCGVESEVRDGGMLCVGINYQTLGEETAKMAVKALNGTSINEIPVVTFRTGLKTYINRAYANEISLTIPTSILEDENTVFVD